MLERHVDVNHGSISFRSTVRLRCKVEPGVFSHERLVRFPTFDGTEYTALVNSHRVDTSNSDTWLYVNKVTDKDSRVLIYLPTADGERVWVDASSIETPND